jgi:hypothetical protein
VQAWVLAGEPRRPILMMPNLVMLTLPRPPPAVLQQTSVVGGMKVL